jgi:mannose-1-phosphate guanylyltransferase
MRNVSDRRRRWGIVLAGGDGLRLRPLTRFICGDDRPKQFCPFHDGATLLELARRRAQRNICAEQIMFSLTRAHEDYYLPRLVGCPSQRVVQPCNRGTAPAILSTLLAIAHRSPDACVAVYPSDHYYSDETVIAEAVEYAFDLSRRQIDSVILVGARPQAPETDYGWIEVGASLAESHDFYRVCGFYEKPSAPVARFLWAEGALWNTLVMVGRAAAFLELFCRAVPGILQAFQHLSAVRAPNEEIRIPASLYARIQSIDFSRQVLAMETERLIVQRLAPATWSDLGDCRRAVSVFADREPEPAWAARWRLMNPTRVLEFPSAAAATA